MNAKLVVASLAALATTCFAATSLSRDRRDVIATVAGDNVRHFEHIHISSSHVLRRSSESEDRRHESSFKLPVAAFNKSWHLELEPASGLFTPDATWGNGDPLTHHGYYRGQSVKGGTTSFVHVHVDEGGLVHGVFHCHEDHYYIRPAGDLLSPEGHNHVIYRASDLVHDDHPKRVCTIDAPGLHMLEGSQSKRQRRLVASPYVSGRDICTMALYLDATFVNNYGAGPAVDIALERFSESQKIFEATAFTGMGTLTQSISWLDLSSSGSDAATAIENLLSSASDAEEYLTQFSKYADKWNEVCLAHAYTYTDFSGTLGLAWTAYPDSENHNGGICQSAYNDPSQGFIALNTAFHTSLNFGNPQPSAQSQLVLTHELGHNYGSQHDDVGTEPANGVFIMYPFANSGTKPNNDDFSTDSIADIVAAVTDRGGCFVETADPVCGNAVIENNATYIEKCDGGANGDTCCAATDGSTDCTTNAAFVSGAVCSPRSRVFGACCFANCTYFAAGEPCDEETSCTHRGLCATSGADVVCNEGVDKEENQTCDVGVVLGESATGSGLCRSGQCTGSICELIGYESCEEIVGEDACNIQCSVGGVCTQMSQITFADFSLTVAGPDNTTTTVTISQSNVPKKAAGATCYFEEGQSTSGLCNSDGNCQAATGEADSLAELRAQYAKFQRLFLDWANEETAGIPNYAWLVIGGILLIFFCCLGCYYANREEVHDFRQRRKSQALERKQVQKPAAF